MADQLQRALLAHTPVKAKHLLVLLLFAAALAAATVLLLYLPPHRHSGPTVPSASSTAAPTYVGAAACRGCHERQYRAWSGSHHQLAMQEANAATVLGDFRDARMVHFKVTSRFFRKDTKFFVNTDGPDGALRDYEVKYTFGVYPLQQYLVAFADGRLQALALAWDSRPQDQGGQRWFHLYPKADIRPGDELHWTGIQQTWNYMCAECHSTDLRKNYDEASNTYRTTWKDISVACEACHGAGSEHVRWAQQRPSDGGMSSTANDGLLAHFDDRHGATWIPDPVSGNSHRSRPRGNSDELEMCGRCHARAEKIAEDWVPGKSLLDTHRVALLDQALYSADGQMQGEVYNYGSFLQSKMFAAGVTCSDCHDPHTEKLRAQGHEVCELCHAGDKYATAAHHHHKEQGAGSRCPACHMPVRTYMVVDRRHDHSFRIPRPDDSVRYGTPNACNDCHQDKTAAWAAKATAGWYGGVPHSYQHFTSALVAARRQSANAGTELGRLAGDATSPAIARATALSELRSYLDADALETAQEALRAPDALMRLAAVELIADVDPATRWGMLVPLLGDPVLAVRSAAAEALVDATPSTMTPEVDKAFRQALSDYFATQKLNADRPEAHLNLGNVYARQGKTREAEAEYREAIRLLPVFAPAYVNLADLSRAEQRDESAERWLTAAEKAVPGNPEVLEALGLLRVRQHRSADALQLLARTAQRSPDNPHYAYLYGVGLYSMGRVTQGLEILRRAHEAFPGNREVLLGLASLSAESGDTASGVRYAEAFVAMAPADRSGQQLLQQLKQSHTAR